jgi:filamentous hemagglutinin
LNLLRYFFLKTQAAFVPFGFSGLAQRSNVASDNAQSAVGKVISHAEAVADATTAAAKAVVIQAGSKRASSSANESSSTARTSSLTAGNNLNIIATDGSINSPRSSD